MSAPEQKKLIPTPPLTPVDSAPVEPKKTQREPNEIDKVLAIRDLISRLSSEGRALLGDEVGVAIPVEMDGADLSIRKYGYRCKACGAVGLEFLGDKEPPRGIPFDRLLFVQDKGRFGENKDWRRQQRKTFPRCMHCSQELAKEPDGSIKESRFIPDISQYQAASTAQRQQEAWARRKPNYRRDSAGLGAR